MEVDTHDFNLNLRNTICCLEANTERLYLVDVGSAAGASATFDLLSIELGDVSKSASMLSVSAVARIDASNRWTQKPVLAQNIPTLGIYDDKLCVLGAVVEESANDDAKDSLDVHRCVAYDATKQRNEISRLCISKFGRQTQALIVDDSVDSAPSHVYLMGGTRVSPHSPNGYAPSNLIYHATLTESSHRWWTDALYLPEAMYGFGLVQVRVGAIRYVVLFGGTHTVESADRESLEEEAMALVYVLGLDTELEGLSESELAQRQKELNALAQRQSGKAKKKKKKKGKKGKVASEMVEHGLWLELKVQLKEAGNYWAFYDGAVDAEVIHLLSWSGRHETLAVKEIVAMAQSEDSADAFYKCNPWTEGGKTVMPTKIKKLKTTGPGKRRSPNVKEKEKEKEKEKGKDKDKDKGKDKGKKEDVVKEDAVDIGKGVVVAVADPIEVLEPSA